jgi:hypothetical protein
VDPIFYLLRNLPWNLYSRSSELYFYVM